VLADTVGDPGKLGLGALAIDHDMAERSASVTKSPSGSMMTCCTHCSSRRRSRRALFEQAAQQMRLARTGIALHHSRRVASKHLLDIEQNACGSHPYRT
jgi:hypothetical protein